MSYVHHTWVVPGGQVVALRNRLQDTEYSGLYDMFHTPMSPTGNLPATHYVSSGLVSEEEDFVLNDELPPAFQIEEEGEGPFQMFARVGLQLINGEV